ncbi:uncharacterized protein BX663DRAFT_342041 [Cokeromyces recurvatus]|uniref:uncharacterized protein n=1 Tax=Cokeromyces recurvatus TaxID=90255 RepID=UPI00221F8503|nr:uncharacterized protein BX663DRAFT_342041 [Cokeromyces recurvatus]KAI7904419.1 hypothetical protein BX663DRAFT_342041 [Cokeromyces recurvatus]
MAIPIDYLSVAKNILAQLRIRFRLSCMTLQTKRLIVIFALALLIPNRKDVFTSYHGANDIRRLSSAEYYDMNGNIKRQKQEQERKRRLNIEQIETSISSPKTASLECYSVYISYMLQNFNTLSSFYGFHTARLR